MIGLEKQDVEYAKTLIESGDAVCPRCGGIGKLRLDNERKFLRTITRLHCPTCGAFWENMAAWREELETKSIEYLREKGLTEPYPFEVPIMLEKDEVSYGVWYVDLYEGRRTTYQSKSMRVSLRVMKGVWVHPRTGGGVSESEDIMKLLDIGSLVLTNRRLVFVGEKRVITTRLTDLINVDVDVEVGQEGFLSIAKHGKQKIEKYWLSMPNLTKELILIAREKHVKQNTS